VRSASLAKLLIAVCVAHIGDPHEVAACFRVVTVP